MNYYNDNDTYVTEWLRNLCGAGLLRDGTVDERSITDVRSQDLAGFERCHFFAGIGGWEHALNLAGWNGPVWTASLPCQPFSSAGKQKGGEDNRHLWPVFFELVRECRPPTIFGEQVEGAIGHGWLDRIFADLEAEGYACGAVVMPACSQGAPHDRDRIWWVAISGWESERRVVQRSGSGPATSRRTTPNQPGRSGDVDGVADTRCVTRAGQRIPGNVATATGAVERSQDQREWLRNSAVDGRANDWMGEPIKSGLEERGGDGDLQRETLETSERETAECAGDGLAIADEYGREPRFPSITSSRHGDSAESAGRGMEHAGELQREREWREEAGRRKTKDGTDEPGTRSVADSERDGRRIDFTERRSEGRETNFWSDYRLVDCADGKTRRIGTGVQPLAYGISGRVAVVRPVEQAGTTIQETHWYSRVGTLRAFGNAIVPQVAAEFIKTVMEVL